MRLDDVSQRMATLVTDTVSRQRERMSMNCHLLFHVGPGKDLAAHRKRIGMIHRDLFSHINQTIADRSVALEKNRSMIDALNPMAILQRGYSITRTRPTGAVVRNAEGVKHGQSLEVLLGRGRLTVRVDETHAAKNDTQAS